LTSGYMKPPWHAKEEPALQPHTAPYLLHGRDRAYMRQQQPVMEWDHRWLKRTTSFAERAGSPASWTKGGAVSATAIAWAGHGIAQHSELRMPAQHQQELRTMKRDAGERSTGF